MIDKNNPKDVEKIIQRATRLHLLLRDFKMIIELTAPGQGDMIVKSVLMGGVVSMEDVDWDKYVGSIQQTVDASIKIIEEAAAGIRQEQKSEPDPSKLHAPGNKKLS